MRSVALIRWVKLGPKEKEKLEAPRNMVLEKNKLERQSYKLGSVVNSTRKQVSLESHARMNLIHHNLRHKAVGWTEKREIRMNPRSH